jgi:hypothetical protein
LWQVARSSPLPTEPVHSGDQEKKGSNIFSNKRDVK